MASTPAAPLLQPPSFHPTQSPSFKLLPTPIHDLIMAATEALLPPFPAETCQKYSGHIFGLSTPTTTVGIYCGLVVLIPMLSLAVPCLANTAIKKRRKSTSALYFRFVLALTLFSISVALMYIQAYTVQIYYYCADTPVFRRYVTMWVLFVVFSGGSVGCAGVGTVNLGLECWRPPPGRRRNWLKWWIFPLVVVGIALAPLVLAYYLWTCWRAGSGAGEGEKDGDIEMGTDVRKGEGGSDLSGETLTNPILKIIAGCEEGKK